MIIQLISCVKKSEVGSGKPEVQALEIKTGAERTHLYLHYLKGKNVAVVANQTSILEKRRKRKEERGKRKEEREERKEKRHTHLVDSLLSLGIKLKKVFAPEHGFRGKADAGEIVKDGLDGKTGLPIISLYGKNKKPSVKQLTGIDVVVFDIQDVGVRFYTYISTLHYVLEACAEAEIKVILLDRPNPNGHYVDGPVLELEHKSFVGVHKVPVVYGMTIGEYGQMINGEKWLKNGIKCDLTIIPLENYTHTSEYNLPIKPSPNLPNATSINLYPSLCFFEGTTISVGRGTDKQFQIVGSPHLKLKKFNFEFTPKPNEGATYPKHKGKTCYGYDLRNEEKLNKIQLKWLIDFYKDYSSFKNAQGYPYKETFFNSFFTKLAGTKKLQQQIEQGVSETEIRKTWENDLNDFQKIRKHYLLYR